MDRYAVNLIATAIALPVLVACGDLHGLGDAGADAAFDSGIPPDTGVDDAGVDAAPRFDAGDDAGSDAGPEELQLHVTVWADAEGTVASADTAWIAIGADGSRASGRTTADGQVDLSLPASGAPYEWTVAASGRGARSLVGLSGDVEAELHLHADPAALPPSAGPLVRITVSGLAETERAAISGSGFFGSAWADTSTLEGIWDPDSSTYSLLAVVYEQRYVWLEEIGSSHPVSPGGSPPIRAQVVIAPTTAAPPAELAVDLSTGMPPVAHEVSIELPDRGYFMPRVHYVDGFWGVQRSPGPWLSHFVPIGANEIGSSGGALRGSLYTFDEPELRWAEGQIWLRDARADQLARIHVDPETSTIVVPPVEGPVRLDGDSVTALRFETNAPAWSSSRYGLLQGLGTEPGSAIVSWVVVAPTGRVYASELPTLPDDLDLPMLGFDTARAANAFVENTHDLRAGAPLRDVPQAPYVDGRAASEGPSRFVRTVTW